MNSKLRPLMWVIAGQDSSGGAGIAADLLSAHDLGVTPSVVITALTAQNSQTLLGVEPCPVDFLMRQLKAIREPVPQAIKIGMLANAKQVIAIAEFLHDFRATHPSVAVVLDPVLGASSGYSLGDDDVLSALPELLKEVDLVTPNRHELQCLTQISLESPGQIVRAAQLLHQRYGCQVLAKGGHSEFDSLRCNDLLCSSQPQLLLSSPRIETAHSHGTGCTLSSAIAAALAQGETLPDAIVLAKAYVSKGLRCAGRQGRLPGAVAHEGWPTQLSDFPTVESAQTPLGQAYGIETCWPQPAAERFAPCQQPLGLYPVVDSFAWVVRLLKAGVRTIQLRMKDPQAASLHESIRKSIALAKAYQAQLFINDYWQLAIEYDAYGVHLGQGDLEQADLNAIAKAGLRLGVSTHGYYEMLRAVQLQPSYIALGHIFATTTKQMPSKPRGLTRLRRYATLLRDFPKVAIGGINETNARDVLDCGVTSLAVVRAITQNESPELVVQELREQIGV